MTRFSAGLVTVYVLSILAGATRITAAEPRDELQLLRLVPPDAAVCLVVKGLREKAKAVAGSPFADWVANRAGPAVGGVAELEQIRQFVKLIESQLGVSLADLRDDIFGDSVVLFYQPGPPGKPDAEQGAVLLKAREPAKLRALIDKLNSIQKAGGEVSEVADVKYRGGNYVRRSKSAGKDEFYFLKDGLFAFSGQESALQQVIDRTAMPGSSAPVADMLKKLGAADAFLTCWINPRRLDPDLAAQVASADDAGQKAFLDQFSKIWAAADGLAVSFDAKRDAELAINVSFDPAKLPPEMKPLLLGHPTRSVVWQAVPNDALFAVGGRVEVNVLLDAVASFTPGAERETVRAAVEKLLGPVVGKANLPAVLAGIGPDWGVWVTPPASGMGWVPQVIAAVRLKDEATRHGVEKAAGFYAQLAAYDYNSKHDDQIDVGTEQVGGSTVTALFGEKVFPKGVRPAFGLKDNYLVLAGSPAAISRFTAPGKEGAAAGDVPVLRVSGSALRAYLRSQGEPFGAWLAAKQGKPADDVAKDLSKIADVLEPVDRVELLVRGDDKRFGVTVRLKLVKPLEK